ncbi:hypothetical protein HFO56_24005 [Rhizobium laguerreae]|uniref:hypothetical protein n=1 Tax=Rhizobium laguerreae TaxID=1076926 RepID=UPI001C92A456|nr:hypothetical protein [Rhizobium laguerreae]MBY3155393.1 hypothetical protein [Rhizobium laguerreae]
MPTIAPTLIVSKTKFVHIDTAGNEVPSGIGVRVLLRYPSPCAEDRSFEIVDTLGAEDIMSMSPSALMKYVQYHNDDVDTYIQFAEENTPGVVVGGEALTWDQLVAEGYEFCSSFRQRQAATAPQA